MQTALLPNVEEPQVTILRPLDQDNLPLLIQRPVQILHVLLLAFVTVYQYDAQVLQA